MKRGHYCTSCKGRLETYYKRYVVEKNTTERGPFYMCENKDCRDYIPTPLDHPIELSLNTPFTWIKKVLVESPLDIV